MSGTKARKEESPNVGHGHHWFGNAESYFLIGDTLGKAMVAAGRRPMFAARHSVNAVASALAVPDEVVDWPEADRHRLRLAGAETHMDVALLNSGQQASFEGPFLAYLTKGKGMANGTPVANGDLVRGDTLSFEALEDVQLIVVHLEN